jgi:acyl carrier protein
MSTIMGTVKGYILDRHLPGEDPEQLTAGTELVRSGILNSLAMLDLVVFLEQEFGIQLHAHDVTPSNLATLVDIEQLVQSKQAAS